MKPSGERLTFLVVLLALALAAMVLWFTDPSHQPPGGSRILWPGRTGR